MNRREFTKVSASGVALGAVGLSALARALPAAQAPAWPDSTWVGRYAGRDCVSLSGDTRLSLLLKIMFPKIRCPFLGCRVGMARVLPACLLVNGYVGFSHGRFALLTGCMLKHPEMRTMVWFDSAPRSDGTRPLAISVTLKPQPTGPRGRRANLWVVSNRELAHFELAGLPANFSVHFSRWLARGTNENEGRFVKLNWLSRSLRIRPVPPAFLGVPPERLHPRSA